jgi:hypothetical protein
MEKKAEHFSRQPEKLRRDVSGFVYKNESIGII